MATIHLRYCSKAEMPSPVRKSADKVLVINASVNKSAGSVKNGRATKVMSTIVMLDVFDRAIGVS